MKTVLVPSIGGLGNQMFFYAFYRKMCIEYPHVNFKLDISDIFDKRYERNAELLRVFPNIEPQVASSKEIWQLERKINNQYRGKGGKIVRLIIDRMNQLCMKKNTGFCYTEDDFIKANYRISDEKWMNIKYLLGYWQDISIYSDYLEILQHEFQFSPVEDEVNKKLINDITTCDSVSVHVRRGDYVGEVLDILDTEYYSSIIQKIKMENPKSHFYFFSNDPEYIEENYSWLKEKTIVKNNQGLHSFRDMQLMSLCKKNIIANSTFSVWAALLNSNDKKEIYYPSHYYEGIRMKKIELPGYIQVTVKGQMNDE